LQIESIDELEKIMSDEREALKLRQQKKFEEAIAVCPKFIDCYIDYSVSAENLKSFATQKEVLERGLSANPNSKKLIAQMAMVHFQFDQNKPEKERYYSNNIKTAEKYWHKVGEIKPGNEIAYYFLALIEGLYKKDYDKAIGYMRKVYEINPANYGEPHNWIGLFCKEKYLQNVNKN